MIVLIINIIFQSVFSSFATNIDGLYVSENTRRNVTVNHSQANGFPSDFGLYLCYGESAITKGYPGNDKMYGGYSFEDEMIPKVEFLTNDIVAAFADKEVILYNMKEKFWTEN